MAHRYAAEATRKVLTWKLTLRILLLCSLPLLLRGQSPDTVLIVVNQPSALSRQIGEYYAGRRHIPASNICRLNASTKEEISRSDFDDQVSRPIQNYLRGHNLTEKVLYIVTTAGVPLKIHGNLGLSAEA